MTGGPSEETQLPRRPSEKTPQSSLDWGAAGFIATLVGAIALGWVWFAYTEAYATANVRPEEVGVDPLRVLSVTVTILLPLAVIFGLPVLVAWMLWRERPVLAWGGAVAAWFILWRLFVWAPSAVFYILVLIGLLAIVLPVVPRQAWMGPHLEKAGRRLTIIVFAGVIVLAGVATANAEDAVRDLSRPSGRRSFAGMVLGIQAPKVCLADNATLAAPTNRAMRLLGTANDVHVLLDGKYVWRVPAGLTALQPVDGDGECVGL